MAQQTINIGTVANDGTGDPLRTAFDKVNDNFTELYADDAGDVNSVSAGTGISVDQTTGAVTVTNTAPDQTVSLTDGTGIITSGTYPDFTITNSAPDQTVSLTAGQNVTITGTYPSFTIASNDVVGAVSSVNAGTGISVDQTTGVVTVTNDAPDQTVALTDGGDIAISGTYPNFTLTNSAPNATHTGDVTGATALTIATGAVDGGKIDTTADVQINSLGVGTAAPTTAGLIRATNDVVAYYSSDERLKDNIKPIENALDKVSKLGGYEFDWNDKQDVYKGHDIGVIAQEVEAVFPELVTDRDNGFKAVKYEKLVPALIEAIKELKAEVESLKSK